MSRRAEVLRLQNQLENKLEQRRPWRIQFRGLLGDHDGNVVCTSGDDRFVYVRREGRAVISNVLNLRVNNIADMPVLVGYSDEFPNRLQVLSIAGGQLGWSLGSIGMIASHHQQHEFRRSGGGGDVVWVAKQQITEILVYPSTPNAMTVETMKGLYPDGDGWEWWSATTSADLSGSVPAAGLARWVLISIDTSSDPHTLQYTDGDTFPTVMFPPDEADAMPDPPTNCVPLACIYLDSDTTEITWSQVYDVRIGLPGGTRGVVTASDHELLDGDVHPDTVDVDPTTGDIIIADGTPEWNVLAIGGAGGILIVNSAANALEYLALGARGGILKVNAAADALEYLGIGAANEALISDGNDPGWSAIDAAILTYTPGVLADWDGAADPGDVDDALDQLAERVKDEEDEVVDAADVTYTPAIAGDWDAGDPGNVDDALDELAERVKDEEDEVGGGGISAVWEPLTNGDAASPALIFGDGDVIMVEGD